MRARPNHYMKADMLQSQFEALEAPTNDEALAVSIDEDADRIVERIMEALRPGDT